MNARRHGILSHLSKLALISDESIAGFIKELKELRGIPWNYLVPDERMLPPESIRFFYIDPDWVASLVDGAFSPGRISEMDTMHDQSVLQNFRNEQIVCSGFLLRSRIVHEFPNFEATAYATEPSERLETVRFEKLSPDIQIGIFAGSLGQLDLHEPPTGIHSGFDRSEGSNPEINKLFKQLKDLTVVNGFVSGEPLDKKIEPVSYRNVKTGVVALSRTAEQFKKALGSTAFTSAEFGLQMVEGVAMVSFIRSKD